MLPFDNVVAQRHAKVAEIIERHLKAIQDEVLALDPETMNIDDAGDKAEIARQVLVSLVDQLRRFGSGARMDKHRDDEEDDEFLTIRDHLDPPTVAETAGDIAATGSFPGYLP